MPSRGQSRNRVKASVVAPARLKNGSDKPRLTLCGTLKGPCHGRRRVVRSLRGSLAADRGAVIGQGTTEVVVNAERKRQRVDVVIESERFNRR